MSVLQTFSGTPPGTSGFATGRRPTKLLGGDEPTGLVSGRTVWICAESRSATAGFLFPGAAPRPEDDRMIDDRIMEQRIRHHSVINHSVRFGPPPFCERAEPFRPRRAAYWFFRCDQLVGACSSVAGQRPQRHLHSAFLGANLCALGVEKIFARWDAVRR